MTKTWARRSAQAGVLAAGVLLFAGGVAQAGGPAMVSAGNQGVANGNQILAPVQIPIDICGNAIAVAGVAGAGCDGGASADLGDDGWWTESAPVTEDLGDMLSAGNNGVLNGNQLQVPVQIPVDVCGNAIAVLGVAGAGCDGGASADIDDDGWWTESATLEGRHGHHHGHHGHHHGHHGHHDGGDLGDMVSAANQGVLNGNQIQMPIQIPVNICGNAIAVAGVAGAGCDGGSSATIGESAALTEGGTLGDMLSAGNNGIGNGNQVQAPVQVPINICGNAIAILGVAGAGCDGGASANIGDDDGWWGYDDSMTEADPARTMAARPGTDATSQSVAGLDANGTPVASNIGGLPIDQALNNTSATLPGTDVLGQAGQTVPGVSVVQDLVGQLPIG